MPKKDRPLSCRELLHDEAEAERRVATALESFRRLRSYDALLGKLATMDPEDQRRCHGLTDAMSDRAYDAEAAGRTLIAAGLQTVNELRDSGGLYEAMQALAAELKEADADELASRLENQIDEIRARFGEGAEAPLQEAADRIREAKFTVASSKERLVLGRPSLVKEQEDIALGFGPQPGQRGRVSVSDFFSTDPTVNRVWPGRLYVPDDCHHRPVLVGPYEMPNIDAYAGILSGLAATKGALYQHARRVDELGHRGMRGNDPVTAILIGIAVVGLALVIIGAATGNGYVVAFGTLLIVGAALVAFGGFALIIGVLA